MQTDRKLCKGFGLEAEALEASRGLGSTDREGRTRVEPRDLLRIEAVRRAYIEIRRSDSLDPAEAR